MQKVKPDMEELVSTIVGAFPKLSIDEQRVSLKLYRLLAEGEPVPTERVAHALDIPTDTVARILNQWPGVFYNDQNRIIGYWGLALPEMSHRFEVNGRQLYTWCAWDSLFIPELIQRTARVESTCPVSGRKIRLTVSPEKILKLEPATAAMSFLTPEAARIQEDVITHFCHFVHFFRSAEAGFQWASENKGTFILTMEEAFSLARKKNVAQYQDVL